MKFFEDIFSSSRGAGVIGALLALLVLVGFGTLFLFVFDKGMQGGDITIESVIRDQDSTITSLKNTTVHLHQSKRPKIHPLSPRADSAKLPACPNHYPPSNVCAAPASSSSKLNFRAPLRPAS